MEHSSSADEISVQHQYDSLCKKAIRCEKIDYLREQARFYRFSKNEIGLSRLNEQELDGLVTIDEYEAENFWFDVMGYNIGVKNMLLAEALQSLPERKRNIVLLYYYQEMTDAEIGRRLKVVGSTIQEQRQRTLKLLRQKMKGTTKDEKIQKRYKKRK